MENSNKNKKSIRQIIREELKDIKQLLVIQNEIIAEQQKALDQLRNGGNVITENQDRIFDSSMARNFPSIRERIMPNGNPNLNVPIQFDNQNEDDLKLQHNINRALKSGDETTLKNIEAVTKNINRDYSAMFKKK